MIWSACQFDDNVYNLTLVLIPEIGSIDIGESVQINKIVLTSESNIDNEYILDCYLVEEKETIPEDEMYYAKQNAYKIRFISKFRLRNEFERLLTVDGVYPDTQSISNNEYPIITPLYCITVKGNDNQNVAKVLDFILSEDGQYLVEQMGYSPVQ